MRPSFHARTGISIKKREEKIDPNFTTTYVVKYFASDFSDRLFHLTFKLWVHVISISQSKRLTLREV